jgi:hypothetical protein
MMQKEEDNQKCDIGFREFWVGALVIGMHLSRIFLRDDEMRARDSIAFFFGYLIWSFRFLIGGLDVPNASQACADETEGESCTRRSGQRGSRSRLKMWDKNRGRRDIRGDRITPRLFAHSAALVDLSGWSLTRLDFCVLFSIATYLTFALPASTLTWTLTSTSTIPPH